MEIISFWSFIFRKLDGIVFESLYGVIALGRWTNFKFLPQHFYKGKIQLKCLGA